MPNFDKFERLLKEAVASDRYNDTSIEYALAMARLHDSEQVRLIKGKSPDEIRGFLVRAAKALRTRFNSNARFIPQSNNLLGKDLLEVNSGTEIELKSGTAMTDAGSGIAIVAWALDGDAGMLKSIMNGGMEERRTMLLAGVGPATIERHKAKSMDDLAAYFAQLYVPGSRARPKLTHFFKCVSVGLTKGTEIRKVFERFGEAKLPLLLQADWDRGLIPYEKGFEPDEIVNVERVERSGLRAQLVARGAKSSRTAKLYPNFKNSWKAGGRTFLAENWVATACFHVWIT